MFVKTFAIFLIVISILFYDSSQASCPSTINSDLPELLTKSRNELFKNNETDPGFDSVYKCLPPDRIKLKTFSARLAFRMSGGHKRYEETLSLNAGKGQLIPYSQALPVFYDSKTSPDGVQHCKFTNHDSILDASDLTVTGKNARHVERGWVNYMLGNFIYGNCPENILFPVNGEVSCYLYNALTVKNALKLYFSNPQNSDQDQHFTHRSDFFIADLFATLPRPISVKHFVGSVDIIIAPIDDSLISLKIFNITSITSADYSTHFKRPKRWPKSMPRQFTPQPYSNSGQVFQLKMTVPEAKKLAGIKR